MSTVNALFFISRPATIVGGIGTVVVDAIDAMGWAGASSHVCEKSDVIVPSFADFDSSPSVIWKVFPFRIIAALPNGSPRLPFGSFAALSVFMIGLAQAILRKATARFKFSLFSQIPAENDAFISAFASAQESCVSLAGIDEGKDGQSIKALAREVNNWVGHRYLSKLGRGG